MRICSKQVRRCTDCGVHCADDSAPGGSITGDSKLPVDVRVVIHPDGGVACAERLPSAHDLQASAVSRPGPWTSSAAPLDVSRKSAGPRKSLLRCAPCIQDQEVGSDMSGYELH